MAFLPLVAAGAGAAVSAFGAIQGGQANAAAARYQQSMSLVNAQIAQRNSEYERAAGDVAQQERGMQARYDIGRAKVAQGASGFDVGTGSPAAVRASMQDVATQGQRIAAADTSRRASGYQVGAMQEGAQAQLYGAAAKEDELSGYIRGISLLGEGLGSVSDKWRKMGQLGMTTSGG